MDTTNACAIAAVPNAALIAHSSDSSDPRTASSTSVQAQEDPTTTHTGFFDLSPELRNRIYELALVDFRPLRIRIKNSFRRRDPDSHALKPFEYATQAIEQDGTERPIKLLKSSANINLLQVNHQTYSEAAPIFYGQNCFDVDFEDKLQYFSSFITSQIRHLRFSDGYNFHHLRSTLLKLRKCTSLQLQTIEFWDITLTRYDIEGRVPLDHTKVAKILLPLMRDMVKARGEEALETFNLYPHVAYEECKTERRLEAAADTKAIKEKLADMLKEEKIKAEAKREAKSKSKGNSKTKSIPESPSSS